MHWAWRSCQFYIFTTMEAHIVVSWAVAPWSLVDQNLDPQNAAVCSSQTFLSTFRTTRCHTPNTAVWMGISLGSWNEWRWHDHGGGGAWNAWDRWELHSELSKDLQEKKSLCKRLAWIEDDIKIDINFKTFWSIYKWRSLKKILTFRKKFLIQRQ